MSRETLTRYRTKVIEDFIMIEGYINAIISKSYLGKVSKKFFWEVLQDEYFNFGLRTNILEKILKELSLIEKPNPLINDLRRLSKLRNYFAHCNTAFFDDLEANSRGGIPDPRKTGEYLNFEEIYKEFNEKIKLVSDQLILIMDKLGILFIVDEETKNITVILE